MIKKIISVAFVAAVFSVGMYSYTQSQHDKSINDITLASVEALAGCETSSDHSNNTGYCSSLVGGGGDACVTQGSGSEPRCSGNY